jgi:hypothetical protein
MLASFSMDVQRRIMLYYRCFPLNQHFSLGALAFTIKLLCCRVYWRVKNKQIHIALINASSKAFSVLDIWSKLQSQSSGSNQQMTEVTLLLLVIILECFG